MNGEGFATVPGARDVTDWFGRVPGFHDAHLLELDAREGASGHLTIHAWNMTDRVDADGTYVNERDAVVTLRLFDISSVSLRDEDVEARSSLGPDAFPAIISPSVSSERTEHWRSTGPRHTG